MADDLATAHADAVSGAAEGAHATIYGEGARVPLSLERFNASRDERARGTGARRLGTFLETATATRGGTTRATAGVLAGVFGGRRP